MDLKSFSSSLQPQAFSLFFNMPTWTQVYFPWGSHLWPLSTLVAALPVVVLFGMLVGRARAHWAALAGASTALGCAVVAFGMPAPLAGLAFLYGMAFAVLRICWVVLAAVFLYDVSVETGEFEILKESVAVLSADRRLQALLIAFAFGAFIEGAAGFGAPVAIAAAVMVGLGFQPFYAAALCLIANTAPVAFGSIGTPIHTLAMVSRLNESDLSAMNARILPFVSLLIAFWLVRTMVSWKETVEVLPAILVTGCTFALIQFYWGNFRDSSLVDIIASLGALVAMVLLLQVWRPRRIWRFPEEDVGPGFSRAVVGVHPRRYSRAQVLRAWMPFALLTLFVLLWGLPQVKGPLDRLTTVTFKVPGLDNAVYRDRPVVPVRTPEGASYQLAWVTATGTATFLAAVLAGLLLGLSPGRLARTFGHTLYRMRQALLAILFMLGLAYVTRFSGMDAVLGLAFTHTGRFYPFFGTFLGWLGVALSGSDTSSNALFGSLQRITAEQLGLSPVLMAAANSTGGVMGKMIAAQTIVVATAATGQVGSEGTLFRFVFWHAVALAAIVGLIVTAYAYVFPQLIPHGLSFVR